MKRIILILKYFIYYIIGFISFSSIAFITQRITITILLRNVIDPIQDLYNLLNYVSAYFIYYLSTYSILYFIIVYGVRKYDKYIVNKLNEKLEKLKIDNKKSNVGGNENGKR